MPGRAEHCFVSVRAHIPAEGVLGFLCIFERKSANIGINGSMNRFLIVYPK